MARSNLLVPAERKKNFTFFSSFREGRIRKILFLRTSGKSMKKKARMVRSLRHPRMKGAIS